MGRTKADVAVSLSLGGYNISITLAQGYNLLHYLKVTAYHTSTSVKLEPGRGREHIC
jgi:hypothetical protein